MPQLAAEIVSEEVVPEKGIRVAERQPVAADAALDQTLHSKNPLQTRGVVHLDRL